MNTLSFAQDSSGNWGYKIGGADTVIPFKSGSQDKYTLVAVFSGTGFSSYSSVVVPVKFYDEKYCTQSGNNITFIKEGIYKYVDMCNVNMGRNGTAATNLVEGKTIASGMTLGYTCGYNGHSNTFSCHVIYIINE